MRLFHFHLRCWNIPFRSIKIKLHIPVNAASRTDVMAASVPL
jgi:hypothetical protein